MADYSATSAVHATLVASTPDSVSLSTVAGGYGRKATTVTVFNRTGSDDIFFTVSSSGVQPTDPAVGGDNTYVVPAAITSVQVPVNPGVAQNAVVVKLISTGAEAYSVVAL